jgi:biotin transport system substrate-specific component
MTGTPEHDSAATALPAPVARPVVATDVALVATFAALLAVCSLTAIPLGGMPVPITLQTFGVLLAGAVLGARRGALAVGLYLAVGLAGLPIFAQGAGGVGVLATPSVGYLLAFPLVAAITGAIVERWVRGGRVARTAFVLAATLIASVVLYAIGVPVMAWRAGVSIPTAFAWNLSFIPLDLIKAALAAIAASAVHRAFPDLLRQR